MPMIYKRFTDKTAEEWRQIYKVATPVPACQLTVLTQAQALQLLEYLVKHGSERVIDDARSHLSLLRMLRQFYYIDPNGKDQGVNVRNRSAELVKLLSDVDAIRTERKKARANRNKYSGVEGGGGGLGMGGGSSSGGRYGGFGSDTAGFGAYQGEVYGDGGGFGGRETDYSGTQRRADQFEEYDEAEEVETTKPARSTASRTAAPKRDPPKPKEPEQDLFDFGDEPSTTATSNGKPPAATSSSGGLADFGTSQHTTSAANDDDDFDDFQSATPPAAPAAANPLASLVPPPTTSTTTSATQFAAPKPVAPGQTEGFNHIFATASPALSAASSIRSPGPSTFSPPPTQTQTAPIPPAGGYKSTGPNYFTSVPLQPQGTATSTASTPLTGATPSYTSSTSAASLGKPNAKQGSSSGGDVFGSLWSTASSKAGVKSTGGSQKGPDLASMAKAKTQAGIWGAASAASSTSKPGATPSGTSATSSVTGKPSTPLGNGLDDLLG